MVSQFVMVLTHISWLYQMAYSKDGLPDPILRVPFRMLPCQLLHMRTKHVKALCNKISEVKNFMCLLSLGHNSSNILPAQL